MNIREAETILGINRSTIGYYAKCGLLKEKDNRFQTLDDSEIHTLKKILILRRMGISIREIQQLSKGTIPLQEILQKTEKKEEELQQNSLLARRLLDLTKGEKDYGSFDGELYWQEVSHGTPFVEDIHDIYSSVQGKKTRRDWVLPLLIVVCVAIVLAIAVPTGWMLYRSYAYNTFTTDFATSLSEGKFRGSLLVQRKTRVKRTSGDDITVLYNMILDAGNGSPVWHMPEEDDVILVSFGEGSALVLSPVEGTEGTVVRYIRKDGGDFMYATEEMEWNDVMTLLVPGQNE